MFHLSLMLILSESPLPFPLLHPFCFFKLFSVLFPLSSSLCGTDIHTHTLSVTITDVEWALLFCWGPLMQSMTGCHGAFDRSPVEHTQTRYTSSEQNDFINIADQHPLKEKKKKKNYAWDYVCMLLQTCAIRLQDFIHEPNQEQWCVPPWKPARALRDASFLITIMCNFIIRTTLIMFPHLHILSVCLIAIKLCPSSED